MHLNKNPDGTYTLRIDRPENMTRERFFVLAARLEKIIDAFGGKLRVVD